MKEPHHQKKVGIGMIMVAASLAMIGILQVAIGHTKTTGRSF
jgi:hypothetical protein